ncbi:hypothetical protein BX661DRAFT_188594 [Kickxella alabastrina]|nr:uncharacterized protein BX661DRAFT_188594 [Kickxella alabastrina]KAI7821105.1 hypothetical protein BX661DRAFT_188594 [Kickxella alabastrina]
MELIDTLPIGDLPTPVHTPGSSERFDGRPISPLSRCSSVSSSSSARRDRWSQVFEHALKSVVHITCDVHVSFDTHSMSHSTATGFVVDANLGIILSNRHVMSSAPSTHYARFENTESIRLMPWYYDPVLDFAFFRYNPTELKRATPLPISLAPEKAVEGMEIRVISCDSGESISVSSGTIADTKRRQATGSCCFDYHVFNTFHCVAAAGTRGGSSGAPVLDIEGDAVALNVGGIHKTQQSLFLPLHRVVKTLNDLRLGNMPARGTLQATFQFEPTEVLVKAGLPLMDICLEYPEYIDTRGMLKITSIVPESPVESLLMVDDVVYAADGKQVFDFESLFDVLDCFVGESVSLAICRNSCLTTVTVPVHDLFAITPTKLLRIGTGCCERGTNIVLCDVSYLAASSMHVPLSGVLVAEANTLFTSAGIARGSIITHLNNRFIQNLDAFVELLLGVEDGAGFMVQVLTTSGGRFSRICVLPSIPSAYSYDIMQRRANSGYWSMENIRPTALPKTLPTKLSAIPVSLQASHSQFQKVHSSIVYIQFYGLAPVGNTFSWASKGQGYVASKEHGIIVCDKSAVPSYMGTVTVAIANSIEVEACVEYIDPIGCFAYLRYNPDEIAGNALEEAPIIGTDGGATLRVGDSAVYLVPNFGDTPILCKTQVEMRSLVPLDDLDPNHEQVLNIEAILLKDRPTPMSNSFICDNDGFLRAMWVSHTNASMDGGSNDRICFGIDIQQTLSVIEKLKQQRSVHLYSLNVEFSRLSLLNARMYGLSGQRADEFSQAVPYVRSMFVVRRAPTSGSDSQDLHVNDIVLKANGKWVDGVSSLAAFYEDSPVELLVCREGAEHTLRPKLMQIGDKTTSQVVYWAGMCIIDYDGFNYKQRKWPSSGIYISRTGVSSPASHISWPQMITHINQVPIKNTSDLIAAIQNTQTGCQQFAGKLLKDQIGVSDYVPGVLVKIKLLNKSGVAYETVIETDELYYPASSIEHCNNGMSKWIRKFI